MVLVGCENHFEIVFCFEFIVFRDRIRGNPDHQCVQFRESLDQSAETYRLFGAAACVVFRVEVKHDILPVYFFKGEGLVAISRQSYIRSGVIHLDFSIHCAILWSSLEITTKCSGLGVIWLGGASEAR